MHQYDNIIIIIIIIEINRARNFPAFVLT